MQKFGATPSWKKILNTEVRLWHKHFWRAYLGSFPGQRLTSLYFVNIPPNSNCIPNQNFLDQL